MDSAASFHMATRLASPPASPTSLIKVSPVAPLFTCRCEPLPCPDATRRLVAEAAALRSDDPLPAVAMEAGEGVGAGAAAAGDGCDHFLWPPP